MKLIRLFLLVLVLWLVCNASSALACDPETDANCTSTPAQSITPTETALLTTTPSISTPTLTSTTLPTLTTTPTITPTATTIPTSTPTTTPSPTPTATSIPTSTPTPTSTATVRPTTIASLIESQALPCLLPDGNQPSNALGISLNCTVIPVQVRAVKAVPTPAPVAVVPAKPNVAATATPKGDAPSSAMAVTGEWVTLAAGAVHWYKIDNGNNFFLDLWLDANGKSDITLAVYAPEQANALSVNLPPKGRGTPNKSDPTHDLYWKGSSANGTWYALVRNYNTVPVQYRLGIQQSTTDRNCVSYWERLPTGEYVYWTDCGHYTDTSKK